MKKNSIRFLVSGLLFLGVVSVYGDVAAVPEINQEQKFDSPIGIKFHFLRIYVKICNEDKCQMKEIKNLIVDQVNSGSPADQVGLKCGDEIFFIMIDDDVNQAYEVTEEKLISPPRDKEIRIAFLRNRQRYDVGVKVPST